MADQGDLFYLVVFIILSFTAAVQIFYHLYFYLAVWLYRPEPANPRTFPVSVIICARNEAEHLRKFLPAVLEQDWPDYEVIVVNDCSEDDSYLVLGELLMKYPHLKVSVVNKDPKFTHNKKFAQFIGIKASRNDILLFTDADCMPESDKWLAGMVSHFHDNVGFVLGYGGYFRTKGILNRYIRYDSLTIAVQYLGMAIRGKPYMGVGRNLAYRRALFFANNGFGAHNHLVSGDDDLFVNGSATAENTAVEFSRAAHTRSVPAASIKAWAEQKKRHLTTAPYYKFRDKTLLITESFTRLFFYSALAVLLPAGYMLPWIAGVSGLRLTVQFVVFYLGQKKLNEQGLLPFLIFFDILSPLINGVLYLTNIGRGSGKNRWR